MLEEKDNQIEELMNDPEFEEKIFNCYRILERELQKRKESVTIKQETYLLA